MVRGSELLKQGKLDHAQRAFRAALELDAENPRVLALLGLAHFRAGEFGDARGIYEQLVQRSPTDASHRLNLGLVYLKLSDAEHAIASLEASRALDPSQGRAVSYLGLAYARGGRYAEAYRAFLIAGQNDLALEIESNLPSIERERIHHQIGRTPQGPLPASPASAAVPAARISSPNIPRTQTPVAVARTSTSGTIPRTPTPTGIPTTPVPGGPPTPPTPPTTTRTPTPTGVPRTQTGSGPPTPPGVLRAPVPPPTTRTPTPPGVLRMPTPSGPPTPPRSTTPPGVPRTKPPSAPPGRRTPVGMAAAAEPAPDRPAEPAAPREAAPDRPRVTESMQFVMPKADPAAPQQALDGPSMISQAVASAAPPTITLARTRAGGTAPRPLSELATDALVRPEDGDDAFEVGANGALIIRITDRVLTRLDGVHITGGDLVYEPAMRRSRGHSTDEAFDYRGSPLHAVTGRGYLIAVPGKHAFSAVSLDDDILYLREDLVFAFQSSLRWENGNVPGLRGKLPIVQFRGDGALAMRLERPLVRVKLPSQGMVFIDADRLAGWVGRVIPRAVVPPAGGPLGAMCVECTGEGIVLVEPAADDAVAAVAAAAATAAPPAQVAAPAPAPPAEPAESTDITADITADIRASMADADRRDEL